MIHIVGLGPGSADALPPRAFALLTGGLPVLLRTRRHPVVETGPLADALGALPDGMVESCDDEYEAGATFDATYDAIVARVLRLHATRGEIVYAVPGHPLIGESTVARLLPAARDAGIETRIVGAPSFVDACLEALGESVTHDLHVVDALALTADDAAPDESLTVRGPILLYQVYSRDAASRAKLALMRAGFPDEHPVSVLRGAGLPNAQVRATPLFALDRQEHDHLTSVWVPALAAESRPADFGALVRIMARLRDPENGCPWDLKQTHQSLRKYLLEEAYEVAEAIDSGDSDHLCDELGDLLLQVVFHAQLAHEDGIFDSGDVCAAICAKLIRRHPHIFGDTSAETAEAVLQNWQSIKAQEKASRGEPAPTSALDGITTSLPALSMAHEVSRRVVALGFEWPHLAQVLEKLDEELGELRDELGNPDATNERIGDELGDVLFTLVNVARKKGIDPEEALRRQLTRFSNRWRFIETSAAASDRDVQTFTLDEMEALWRQAKSPH